MSQREAMVAPPAGIPPQILARLAELERALGVTIYNAHSETFEFKPGPIFSNFLLADEINRTTPKTQSALLEAMNEGQVTIDGKCHSLPRPFMVIATQNPVEHHGTYPLPESQLDRFLMRIRIGYPDATSEREIVRNHER